MTPVTPRDGEALAIPLLAPARRPSARGRRAPAATRPAAARRALLRRTLVSEDGQSRLVYGVYRRSWVAIGDPVGAPGNAGELVWRLRETSARCGAGAVYGWVHAAQLPLYIALGYRLFKMGESAVVALTGAAANDAHLATAAATREAAAASGARAFVLAGDAVAPRVGEPHPAPASHDGGAGRVVLVRAAGGVVAAARARVVPERAELVVEHVWQSAHAPPDLAPLLGSLVVAELVAWAIGARLERVDLGVAPLAGLARQRLASPYSRLGAWVYEHAERVFPFRATRERADAFAPAWEPRYLAVPHAGALPGAVLAMRALTTRALSTQALSTQALSTRAAATSAAT